MSSEPGTGHQPPERLRIELGRNSEKTADVLRTLQYSYTRIDFRFDGPSATRWNATYDINFRMARVIGRQASAAT